MSKAVLVLGATGKQGGAVIDYLLKENADFVILAVTRDTNSASAQRLAQKSPKIKPVQGDFSDVAAIFENAKKATNIPIWGVFSVQAVTGAVEEQQGKAVIDEALKANVKFFVYTSVDRHGDLSSENPTDVPHFITKHKIEQHLINSTKATDMQWTILRPTAFLENMTPNLFGKVFATTFKTALKGKPLQLIAVSDIGVFGAQALLKPADYAGKSLSLAGDDLTYDKFAQVFKAKTGKEVPVTFEFVAMLLMWLSKDFGNMFRWFHDQGYAADVELLRKMHPGLKDFGTWLETDSQWLKNKSE